MVQEIITYMIIGSAVTLVLLKAIKQFVPKKQKPKETSNTAPPGHNCAACSADCQLRDLPRYVIERNAEECVQLEKKSQLLQP